MVAAARRGFKMVLRPIAAATRGFTMVLFTEAVSRRNTFVGCAPTSVLLVSVHSVWSLSEKYNNHSLLSIPLEIEFSVHISVVAQFF